MALTPENEFELDDDDIVREYIIEPSRTYLFNFETGELENKIIDQTEAIRQFIKKTIYTSRLAYYIYDDEYGCEIHDLKFDEEISFEFLSHEAERMITDALIYDDRIEDVVDVTLTRDNDKLLVDFTVVLNDGATLKEGVWV